MCPWKPPIVLQVAWGRREVVCGLGFYRAPLGGWDVQAVIGNGGISQGDIFFA